MLLRLKMVLVLVLSGVAVYLGMLNLGDRSSWKQATDRIDWSETGRGIVAAWVPASVEAAADPHPEAGDVLVSVNGIPVGSIDELTEVLEFLSRSLPGHAPAGYVLQRPSGEEFSVPIAIVLESRLSATDLILMAVAFAYLAIGLFIFLRRWESAGAFHFFVVCLVAFVLLLFRHSGRADTFDLLVYWINAVAFLLLPPLFLHFCLYFPQPLRHALAWPRLRFLIYAPAAFLGAIYVAWFGGSLAALRLPRTERVSALLDQLHLLHFALYLCVGVLVLFYARRGVGTAVQRLQMKWITYGSLLGVAPFVLLYVLPFAMGWVIHPWMESSVIGLILIPLSFGYAITRYRLTDVHLIFKKSAAYLMASSALLAIYLGMAFLIGGAVQDFSDGSDFMLFALGALAVAFLFAPLKNRIQEQIDRYFYSDRYDFRRSFADFGRTLNSEVSLESLGQKITDRIQKTLNITPVAIFLRDNPRGCLYKLYKTEGLEPAEDLSLAIPDEAFSQLVRTSSHLFAERTSPEVQALKAQLRQNGFDYVRPLQVHERTIGFLGLGKREDGEFLDSEDLQLVDALADYAAIAIDNALLYGSLQTNAAELAEVKNYNENVIQSITLGVAVVSPESEVTIWNSRMEAICGVSREEALGRPIQELLPRSLVQTLQQVLEKPRWVVREATHLHKTRLEVPGRETRVIDIVLAPFVSKSDIITGTLLVFDDVTEKVQLENQLQQAEKLSSIGLFAAGVAHEVNTPLAGISSYVQMLIKETDAEDSRLELLQKIEKQSFRASNIVNNLLNFARVSETDFKELNLNSLMLETLSLLDHQMRKGRIEIELDLDPSLPSTVGNSGKLQQVFMNLFVNAKDAMPNGGKLRLSTHSENSTLVVSVEDSGHGISDQNIKKIYDPFFTTKGVGEGTGLGLSVSYGIVRDHSGRIGVHSIPGNGTTFTLELPVRRIQ